MLNVVAPRDRRLLDLIEKTRLGLMFANVQAYSDTLLITVAKSFIIPAPGARGPDDLEKNRPIFFEK